MTTGILFVIYKGLEVPVTVKEGNNLVDVRRIIETSGHLASHRKVRPKGESYKFSVRGGADIPRDEEVNIDIWERYVDNYDAKGRKARLLLLDDADDLSHLLQ